MNGIRNVTATRGGREPDAGEGEKEFPTRPPSKPVLNVNCIPYIFNRSTKLAQALESHERPEYLKGYLSTAFTYPDTCLGLSACMGSKNVYITPMSVPIVPFN